MLTITIPAPALEEWDERNEEFVYRIIGKETTISLEHSLVSLSKWESKWCKPFLHSDISDEEFLDYIKCMTLTPNVSPEVYKNITEENKKSIVDYIYAPMTATKIPNNNNAKKSREKVTSELIYYWMISLGIPFECQKWHINRLISLIKVCEFKNTPPKKQSMREIMSRNSALNAARRKKIKKKG